MSNNGGVKMSNNVTDFLYEHYNPQGKYASLIESKILSIMESQDEVYKEEMRKFFPSIWNEMKGSMQTIIPIATERNRKEEAVIKKYTKGLNVQMRLNHSPSRNAYTYPWIGDGWLATLTSVPVIGPLFYFINGYSRVFREQNLLKPVLKNGVITFPKANKLQVMAFQTKGLLSDLEERQRVAVTLHEIGHWYNAKSALTSGVVMAGDQIITKISKQEIFIFPPLAIAVFITYNLINRYAEKSADMFAKKCGFGEDLAQALDRILLRPRTDVSWINKVGDWIVKIIMHIQNVLDKVTPFLFSYPSAQKRKEYLRDNIEFSDEIILEELYHIEKILNEGKVLDMGLKLLKKPLNKMDSVVGKKLEILFPIK